MNDAAALAELMCELGYETTKSEMQIRVERIVSDERCHTFVAVRDGKVCGMICTLTNSSYEHNDLSWRIVASVVVSTLRLRVTGTTLIANAENVFGRS